MTFAPLKIMNGPKMQTKMSTWTPLNHQPTNEKVFGERGELLGKWFDKWTDTQRRKILLDLFKRCSVSQLKFCEQHLHSRVPMEALDFTCFLPRVLALYIFSFLDPRSLCRCAQVNWHWKDLTELDQLWMPKCLRLGWYISFSPTPYEQRIWKRHYIEMVKALNVTKPKTPPKEEFIVAQVHPLSKDPADPKLSTTRSPAGKVRPELPPWRGSDRHPTDTIRFNYLDNSSPIELTGSHLRPICGLLSMELEASRTAGRGLNIGADPLPVIAPTVACGLTIKGLESPEKPSREAPMKQRLDQPQRLDYSPARGS